MSEHSMMQVGDSSRNSELENAVGEKLRLSLGKSELVSAPAQGGLSNSESALNSIAQYKAGRYALVTAEGLSLLPSGMLNAVKHNIDNPGEFAVKMGSAAALGAGMRFLLPQSGAARAVVGTVMTYLMAKDAAMPVIDALGQVSDNNSLSNLHDAANRMSNGLGMFTVDMAAGLPVGLAADKLTGMSLKSTTAGRSFESWKDNFYGSKRFGFEPAVSEGQKSPMTIEERLKSIKEGRDGNGLSLEEKLKLIQENLDHQHAAPRNLSPDAEAAFKAYLEHKRWHKSEMQGQIDTLLGDNARKAESTGAAPSNLRQADSQLKVAGNKAESADSAQANGNNDAGEIRLPKLMDSQSEKSLLNSAAVPEKDAGTVSQMSVVLREIAGKVSDNDKQIANFKESVQSPLTQTMREGPPPLDRGHFENNKALIDLTSQISTPEHYKQAGFLLEHHRVANVQMGIPEQLPEIVDLNQYSRSIHKSLMDVMSKNGIDPSTYLRGTNSPVFLIFDSNGAGPYTIPAIKGVSDTPVIVLPREYQNLLGVHVAGVYPHELGHDLIYGDLLRFPDSLREKVLNQDVVAEAMHSKGIANTEVEVPGHGKMKKSDFFTKLLLAEANENTADIFGTSIDPNTPLSLATLLGSLRKPLQGSPAGSAGALETRSMYGQEFLDESSNPLGIEPHGIDAWRIKLGAEVLRQLSEGDSRVVTYADNLDRLSESLRRPGDNYVWASMDNPGQFVAIPIKEWDAIIPGIVKAQLETPLPALNNKTLKDVYPDMRQTFPRVDSLADRFAASARQGDTSISGFDKSQNPIEDIYSAGLSGWMKAIAQNPEAGKPGYKSPEDLLASVNEISRNLTALYRGDNYLPYEPSAHLKPSGIASIVSEPAEQLGRSLNRMRQSNQTLNSIFNNWTEKASIGAGLALTREAADRGKNKDEELKKTGS